MENDNESSSVVFWVVLSIIIVIVVIVVIYLYNRTSPNDRNLVPIGPTNPLTPIIPPDNLPNTLNDCGTYGNRVSTGNFCPAGKSYYGGVCYTDVWTDQGGVKTGVCSVDYGPYGGVSTDCGQHYYLNQGDPCLPAGSNLHKTALCSCQSGGIVTASQYCQNASLPISCPPGTDTFDGGCLGASCPQGYRRTGLCTCQKNGT